MVCLSKFACLRFLFISVFLTFAVAAIDSPIAPLAWADSADTGGSGGDYAAGGVGIGVSGGGGFAAGTSYSSASAN
jgi:hypothetical protein